jgi:polyisoprenyl-phosphate glycosyltransferase
LMRRFYRLVFRCAAPVTSFRIIRRELLVAILSYKLNYTYIDGLLAWNTQRIGHVEVEHHPRRTGRSGYSLAKLVRLALDLLTNFSLVPLQVASIFGLVVALCGFVTGLFYLVEYFRAGISIPGYASTIVAILILGGTQLVALGMIGEYVGRMHLNVNLKPQYTERQVKTRQPAGEK